MEQTKETITASLISIRGGLSVISKCSEAIKAVEEQKEQLNKDIKSKERSIEIFEEDIIKLENNINKEELLIQQKKQLSSDDLAYITNKANENTPKHYIHFQWGNFIWCWLSGAVVGGMFCMAKNLAVIIIGMIIAVGIISSYPIYIIVKKKNRPKKYQKNYNELKNKYSAEIHSKNLSDIRKSEENINYYKNKIKSNQINKDKLTNELDDLLIKKERLEIDSKVIIRENSTTAKSVALALQERYGMIIDESDWKNIDLIIHYIVTGRADTVKEALYQVDRQRQTEQIVHAIKEASQAVGNHINNAFNKLGTALTESFTILDIHIQSIGDSIRKSNEISQSQNEKLLDKIEKHIEETKVQNVLLEKATRTSDELLSDLKYAQNYW